jgi:MinD-like ATPase involved in chromosome partitioning or flagellar assembly
MKILVASRSGNVGKSTIAKHLLSPRMGNAPVVPVESINSDDSDTDALRGKQFAQVQDLLLTVDNVVIDLGASNHEDFFGLMETYAGSHEDFDLFVIPTVMDSKQVRDTVMTVRSLADLGVPARKIVTVFNRLEKAEDVDTGFAELRAFYEREHLFMYRREAVVFENPIYATLRAMGSRSIAEIRDDAADYKTQLADALKNGDNDQATVLKSLIATRRLASGVSDQLDRAFEAITRKAGRGE